MTALYVICLVGFLVWIARAQGWGRARPCSPTNPVAALERYRQNFLALSRSKFGPDWKPRSTLRERLDRDDIVDGDP